MSLAGLIETIQSLPEAKQVEVYDFVAFLAQRSQPEQAQGQTLAQSSLAKWINNPQVVADATPLSREEANAR